MRVLSVGEGSKNKVIFHKYDQKILSMLCGNARIPLSKIAQILKLSRQSVEYRLKTMEKEHLIAGSRAVIDIKKLGYHSYHFLLTVHDDKSENELINRCLKSNFVNVLISYSGKWNYELSLMAKSPEEAQNKFLEMISDLVIVDYIPTILLKTIKASVLPEIIPDKPVSLKYIKNDPSFSKQFLMNEINHIPDDKDKELLYLLSQNAQLNLSQLGKKLKLGRDAVAYRMKKLIRARYILEFRPVIDYSVLSLSVQTVLVKANRSKKEDDNFRKFLKEKKNVLWASEVFGSWDYILYILTKNQEEINSFVDELQKKFSSYIYEYEILFAYKEHKYSFMTEEMKG